MNWNKLFYALNLDDELILNFKIEPVTAIEL